ncbi:MAG: histidine kinase [Provencibacterium sp.]|jgi:two-component system sensor histidine kinase YesM|nr:histidine kinase [Provencibacterium sp.]
MPLIQRLKTAFASSLQIKLAVFFLAGSSLPILLFGYFLSWSVHRVIADKETLYITDKLGTVNQNLSGIFSSLERSMTAMLTYEPLLRLLEKSPQPPSLEWYYRGRDIENIMRSLTANTREGVAFTILTQDGVYSPDGGLNHGESMQGELAKRVLEDGWKTSLFERACTDYLQTPVVTIGKAVKLQGEPVSAILVADIPCAEIDRMFELLDRQVSIYIFDGSSSPFYARTGSLPVTPELLLALEDTPSGGEVAVEGVSYLCVRSADQALQTFSLIPLRSVYRDSKRNSLLSLGIFLVIGIETAAFLRFFSARFSREIKALNSAVADFAEGGGRQPICISPLSHDELGELSEGVCAMSRRIVAMLETLKREERLKRRLEFQSLQSQINPHMIYNTLNTITYLAQMQGVENIAEVSGAFGQMLRILSKTEGELLTIRREIDYIRSYMAIKKYHLVCNVRLLCNVDPELWEAPILKLLLQPFVENALIHGFSQPAADAVIEIDIRRENGYICIRLRDNGEGMSERTRLLLLNGRENISGSFHSVGVRNTVERLRLHYEDDCYFHIDSAPGKGCMVDIHYPEGEDMHAENPAGR